jgi:two-component system, NarL family, nitrate/nitrite response regulator NarL
VSATATAADALASTRVLRVFVAAHVRLYRDALTEVISRESGVEVVGASGAREQILAAVAEVEPDIVLLDPAAAQSLQLIRELVDSTVRVRIVALAASEDEQDVIDFAEAGVSGFVTCEESVIDLVSTIRRAAHGELVCSPRLAGALLRRVNALAAQRPEVVPVQLLTPREQEVASLLEEGLSNKQIALRLHLQVPTVKHHVHHILRKLGVSRRGEAVAWLRRRGLLVAQGPPF